MEVKKLKKLSVKITSIVLAICLLIGVVPMSIFAEESNNNVYVDVTLEADKTDYADGDSIVFNGDIVNSSSKNCDADVEIDLYATPSIKLDTKSLKVNALAAGESHNLTVEATANRTHFGFKLIQAIYDIVTGYMYTIVLEIVSLFSSNYECVRVYIDGIPAAIMYKVDSSVVLNSGDDDIIPPVDNDTDGDNNSEGIIPEQKDKYILKYNLGGIVVEGYPQNQILEPNQVPDEPIPPEKDGYIFLGWYTSTAYDSPFYFENYLDGDIEIYAKWEVIADASEVQSITDKYADEILSQIIDKEGSVSIHQEDGLEKSLNSIVVKYTLSQGDGGVSVSTYNNSIICDVPGLIGDAVDINLLSEDTLEDAEIIFNYDETQLPVGTDENNLGILWWDETNNKMVLLDSTVNTEANSVSVTTNHFSKYLLVDTNAWITSWEHKQMVPRDETESLRFNVVLCLDDSGSMSGSAKTACQNAARSFVDQLLVDDRIAVVKFTSSATTLVSPTVITNNNRSSIKSKITLSASGGTDFDNALSRAISLLNSMPETTDYEIYKPYIVFISDGQDSVSSSSINTLVSKGYKVITIGVGNSVSASVLQNLANLTSGSYAYAATGNELENVFAQMQGEHIGLTTDTDGDGIPDLIETSGMIAENGYIYRTYPDDADSDGDGISDGEEMGCYDSNKGYFIIKSNPMRPTANTGDSQVSVNAYLGYTNRDASTNVQDYLSETIHYSISVEKLKVAWDLLSENVCDSAKDVKLTIETTQGAKTEFNIGTINAGSTYKNKFQITVDDISDSKGIVTITVSGSNFSAVTTTVEYNLFEQYEQVLTELLNVHEKKLCASATTAVRAYAEEVEKAEKELEDIVILNSAITNLMPYQNFDKDVIAILKPKLAKIYKDKALEYAQNNNWLVSRDAEDVIKSVAKQFCNETSELTFTLKGVEYKATIEETSYMAAGFGTVTVKTESDVSYLFIFSTSPSQAKATINNYMDACEALANDQLNACLEAVKSDSMAVLGLDAVEKLIKSKCGDVLDTFLAKKGLKFKFTDIKNYYEYYQTAKKAVSACVNASENPSEKRIDKAIKSVNSLIQYGNKF